ncbi:MAG: cupin domain-containing protein [Anaerolineae bacterium]|nr:cupin domain-containing protein [Anaerolineae bacterium]
MPAGKPKVVHYTQVPVQVVGDEAPGVSLRWLINEANDGAPNYALRFFEIAPGGHTPDHAHPWEQENFVLEGKGRVLLGETWHDLEPGDVVFVPADVRHSYENTGDAPFRFLCGIPVESRLPKDTN